jgi:phytoene desaturase
MGAHNLLGFNMPTALAPVGPSRTSTDRRGKSVVIVGAGPGGLAAALLLRHAGVQVTVVERLPHVGGRTSSIRSNGYRFDLGPTFFLYPRVLERIFTAIGRNLWADVPMARLDPQYRVLFGTSGGQLDCTPNLDLMAERVAKLDPADGANVKRFIADNRVKLEKFRPALESPFLKWTDLLSWDLIKLLPILRPWASVDGELQRYFRDPRVRLSFTFQSKYLGMSPFNCPSLFSILSYLEYDFGVWHPYGGCGAVSEKMADIAREHGVEFRLGEPVTELLFEGKKAVGVKTTQGEYRADAVVLNADFAQAMTKLVPNNLRKNWTDAKLAKKRFSCSTFMMYLGLDGAAPDLPHHTIYTSENYLQNLDDIENAHKLSEDPSVYVQNACTTDPGMAPKGQHTLYVLAPVTHQHGNVDWAKEAPAFRVKVLKQLEKLGISDVERRTRTEQIITPAGWQVDHEIFKGATFNLAHNLGQMLHLRPRNRFEDLQQVYLVGGGTHPGSGLPVIYESARITSRLLLNDFGLDANWLETEDNAVVPGQTVA